MTAHYGFIRQSLTPGTDYTIAATSGGTTTTGGSLWFALHSENRQGVNLPGTLTQVTWTAGQKVVVTINSSARATGEEPFRYTLAAATTNIPANLRQLAYIWAIDPVDQRTPEALPLTLELTRDQDFVLAGTSATVAALPASPLDGTMRTVTADGLRYEADNGLWTAILKPFSTYLASTADANGGRVGCDRPLNQLSSAVIIEPLPYTPDGSLQASPVRIDLSNGLTATGGAILPQGTALAFQLFVAGQDVTTRFSGKVYVTLLGYVDRATGILDTTPSGTGAALPYTYLSSGTGRLVGSNILLPRDLARGFAAAYRVALKVSAEELNATGEPFADGSAVEILVTPIPPRGFYDSSYNITGNLVYQDPGLEYLRILPTVSGVERQGGVCTIAGYTSPLVDTQSLSGLTADLALQKIAIDATLGAQVTLRSPGATLLPTEALRALVSTTPGSYTASPWQTPIAITPGQNLTITVTHPTTIRSNYPDRIAGTVAAFTVPRIRVFVRLSGIIYELPTPLTVAPGSTQTATTISSLSGWTSGATLPNSSASPGFGLYGYGAIVPSGGGSGSSLGAGSYEVAIAWHYPSPNTRATIISHDPNDGCIPEAEGTFSDLFADKGRLYVSSADTTINYLENKLIAGTGVVLTKLNPGANEQIQIAAPNPITVQDEGISVVQRNILNFVGSPVTVTDNASKTQVSISAYTTFTGDPTGFTPTVANQLHVKTDNSPNLLYRSTGTTSGALTAIGAAGGVTSVFGRTGVVTAANGDYNASQVTVTPYGNIAATTVQAAIQELDDEKQPDIQWQDEGVNQGTAGQVTTFNITGAGATLSVSSGTATLNIPGGSGIQGQDEGIAQGTITTLNVTGAGASLAVTAGVGTLNIPGGAGGVTFTLQEQASAPITGVNEATLWLNTSQILRYREESSGTDNQIAVLGRSQTYTAAQGTAQVALTDGATISVDAALSNSFTVTLGGNRTLANPTNTVAGFTYVFRIVQDATGGRTLAYGTNYKFPGGTVPTLSTAANAVDILTCYCAAGGGNLNCTLTKDFK
jgi:hypothetical protein